MSKKDITPFDSSSEHLLAELGHLDLLVHREVLNMRRAFPAARQDVFKGMFISDGEIDQLIEADPIGQAARDDAQSQALHKKATGLANKIARRRQAGAGGGVFLSLAHLSHLFALSLFEERVIVVCLAPELDPKYEKLYAYLQDDIMRKRPSVELVLRLLCRTPAERIQARAYFSPQSHLFRSQILRYLDGDENPLPARTLKLDEPVVSYLLGLDRNAPASCRFETTHADLQGLHWPEGFVTRLVESTALHLQDVSGPRRRLIYNFQGPYGAGKKSLACAMCHALGVPVLTVDLREVLLRAQDFERTLCAIFREGLLQPSAIYLEHFDLLLEDDSKSISQRRSIAQFIDEYSWLTFIVTEKGWEPGNLFNDHLFFSLELPMPDMVTRAEIWASITKSEGVVVSGVDWGEMAAKFRLTPGQMRDALKAAHNYARLGGGDGASLTTQDLYKGCRLQSNRRLDALARKLSPQNTWADITLPENALAQLREICAQVKHRQTVYGAWGFSRKQSRGKGLCVLFYGQGGTGKTLAVEIIATELGLDAFKIDLSTVVSKYIGETEKNLGKVFHEAETSNAILFFDEADALFGKRSEVKDAHDRYANIEINYLLQRMEEFEGMVVLATNLRNNIDDAFFRRMHFAVEFLAPDENHRYRIWKQHFPEAAPVSDDVDFNFLASRFKIAGGNIRNIVVNAAFLAAENSGVIHMSHLIQATRREYEKVGRLCTDAEFGPYNSLLRGN